MTTLLFFDDWWLASRLNVVRRQGRPRWIEDATHEDACIEGLANFPTVFQPEPTLWRGFYWMYAGGVRLLVADSPDGRTWWRRASGMRPLLGRTQAHEVFGPRPAHFVDAGVVFVDGREPDPSRRLKFVYMQYGPGWRSVSGGLATSPDGLRWRTEPCAWHAGRPDPPFSMFYRAADGTYVISCRPSFNDRRVAFVETHDWVSFSAPRLVMHPLPTDPPLTQYFGMPVFPYEDHYVGLLWYMHCDPYEMRESKIEGGIDCRLAYSYDGRMFNRVFEEPFIPRNPRGQHGSGCVYPSSLVVDDEHVIRIYAGSSFGEHFRERSTGAEAALLLYTLRLDGFVRLESYSHTGWVTTRPFRLRGDALRLNIRAPHGQVRVEITDDQGRSIPGFRLEEAVPIRGDELFGPARWRERQLGELVGRWVRIRVELTHAELYAVRGDLEPFSYPEYMAEHPEAVARWERLRTGE